MVTHPSRPLVLSVDHWDGQRHQLVGRTAYIVAFILANSERINGAPRGSVSFNFDGGALRPELHESWPHVSTNERDSAVGR